MGIFEKLNAAPAPTGGGFYYKPGEYEFEVVAVKEFTTRGGEEAFVVDTRVITSNNPDIPEGAQPSVYQGCSGAQADIGPITVKSFLAACLGLDAHNKRDAEAIGRVDWKKVGMIATSSDNPFEGFRVHTTVFPKTTKKGKEIDVHKFTPSKNPTDFQKQLAEDLRSGKMKGK